MNTQGTNILPMIGFIIIVLVLFTGIILFKKNNTNSEAKTDIYQNVTSKFKKSGGYTLDEKKDLATQGIDRISVDAVSANVNIYTHTQDSVIAYLYGEVKTRDIDSVPYLELVEEGQTAVVRVKHPKSFHLFYFANLQLDVTIPECWLNDLDIRTVSGNISAQKLSGADISLKSSSGNIRIQDATGNITIETVSGEIEADTLNGDNGYIKSTSGDILIAEAVFSDSFEATSVSGKCHIDKLECTKAILDSNSGGIKIEDAIAETLKSESTSGTVALRMRKGSAELKTASGNIKAEFEESFNLIKAKSISGTVSLTLPENSQFSLDASSTSGTIRCRDFPIKISSSNDKSLVGVVGSGDSVVNIKTTSGNILIGN